MKKIFLSISILCLICFALVAGTFKGRIDFINGSGSVQKLDGRLVDLMVNDEVQQGEIIIANANSFVDVEVSGSFFRVAEKSSVRLEELKIDSAYSIKKKNPPISIKLNLMNGSVLSKVKKLNSKSDFKVSTPTAVCGVRGTFFETSHFNETKVKVMSGVVSVSSFSMPHISVNVMPGQVTTVSVNAAPTTPRPMTNTELQNVESFAAGSTASSENKPSVENQPSEKPEAAPTPSTPAEGKTELKSEGTAEPAQPESAGSSEKPSVQPGGEAPATPSEQPAVQSSAVPPTSPVATPSAQPVNTNSVNVNNILTNTTVTGSVNNPITSPTIIPDAVKKAFIKVNVKY